MRKEDIYGCLRKQKINVLPFENATSKKVVDGRGRFNQLRKALFDI